MSELSSITPSDIAASQPPVSAEKTVGKENSRKDDLRLVRRVKLRHLLFGLLMLSGIVPLLISNFYLIQRNEEALKTQEQVNLTQRAQAFAENLSNDLARVKDQLRLLGRGLLEAPGLTSLEARLKEPWVLEHLTFFSQEYPEIIAFRVIPTQGSGLASTGELPAAVEKEMQATVDEALRKNRPVYHLVNLTLKQAGVIVAVPVTVEAEDGTEHALVVEALVEKDLSPFGGITLTASEAGNPDFVVDEDDREGLFLVKSNGDMLWSGGLEDVEDALRYSVLVKNFQQFPDLSVIGEYNLQTGPGDFTPTLARLVQVPETGWGVVAHKPADTAFREVRELRNLTLITMLLMIVFALVLALLAARLFSRPIQRMVQATHEIAAGNFKRRVRTEGLAFEIADLAEDFNRMGDYVENYIEKLRKAAEENHDLFISSIRAFAGTIDAKDPYTRGHSERVAAYSRTIAQFLGLPKDAQLRIWISAVLHDVGKIGIEDSVLKKGSVLTPEEFEQMKKHPVLGAEIVKPISQLQEMIPGIRWHHEAWNGSGYPDGLKGEQIPLMARIIGVADTFDAITTNRPYQTAYSDDYALKTIQKLTGTKFDAKIVTAFLHAYKQGMIKEAKELAEKDLARMQLKTTTEKVAPTAQ